MCGRKECARVLLALDYYCYGNGLSLNSIDPIGKGKLRCMITYCNHHLLRGQLFTGKIRCMYANYRATVR